MWHRAQATEVRWRPGKEKSLAPPCSTLGLLGVIAPYWRKTCDIFGTFWRPLVNRRPRHVPPLPSSLRPWCDTSRQSAQLWNLQSPECQTTCPSWDITATLVLPCRMPHERQARQVLLAKPTAKRPRGRPRSRWSNCISDIAWSHLGVEQVELSEIAVDPDIFQVLHGLLPPWPSLEEKQAWKWMKWITFTLLRFIHLCLKVLS